jgi:hypothetical protein
MAVDLLRARHQRGRYSAQTLRQSKRRQGSNLGPSGSWPEGGSVGDSSNRISRCSLTVRVW